MAKYRLPRFIYLDLSRLALRAWACVFLISCTAILAFPQLALAKSLAILMQGPLTITLTDSETDRDTFVLEIANTGQSELKPSVFTLENPTRLVVDIEGFPVKASTTASIKHPLFTSIRTGIHPSKMRLVLDITRKEIPTFTISTGKSSTKITIVFVPRDDSPPPSTETPAPVEEVKQAPPSAPLLVLPKPTPEESATTETDQPNSAALKAEPEPALTKEEPKDTAGFEEPSELQIESEELNPIQPPAPPPPSEAVIVPEETPTPGKAESVAPVAPTPEPAAETEPEKTEEELLAPVAPEPEPQPKAEPAPPPPPAPPAEKPPATELDSKLPIERVEPTARKTIVQAITFDTFGDKKLFAIRVAVDAPNLLEQYRLNQKKGSIYELELQNARLAGEHLALPQFPPDGFQGFDGIVASEREGNVIVKIFVEDGTKLAPFLSNGQLWVKIAD